MTSDVLGAFLMYLTSDAIKIEHTFNMNILGPFLVIFCRLHVYLSQKLGLDGHFEVSNISKP